MREFDNSELTGRGGEKVTVPAVWTRRVDSEMLPVTPRRLMLMACYMTQDGKPQELAFERKINKVLDQLEPQERRGDLKLVLDTEELETIRPWVNKDAAIAWPIDAPFIVDGFDKVIDGQKEEETGEVKPSSDGDQSGHRVGLLAYKDPLAAESGTEGNGS